MARIVIDLIYIILYTALGIVAVKQLFRLKRMSFGDRTEVYILIVLIITFAQQYIFRIIELLNML